MIGAFFVPERWSKKFLKILFVISEKSSQLVSEGKNLTNLENRILPSEKAFAYKMRLEAMKRQAGRPSKENASPLATNKKEGF